MYGITIKPMMIKVGMTTPAIQGSKYTSISWRPRKYHGALAGFMVTFGLAGSSSGAFKVNDQTMSSTVTRMATRNSIRIKYGQVWTSLSHLGSHSCVLRYLVLAACASPSRIAISLSFAIPCRSAYHMKNGVINNNATIGTLSGAEATSQIWRQSKGI